MIFGKLNRFFAKHGRLTGLIIFVVIAFPLGVFFNTDWSRFRLADVFYWGGVARMPDGNISRDEFYTQLYGVELFQVVLAGRGRGLDLREGSADIRQVAPYAMDRVRLLREAKRLGLDAVNDDEIRDFTFKLPAFSQGPKQEFDAQMFQQFVQRHLSERGMPISEYDRLARNEIIIQRLQNRVTGTLTIPQAQARQAALRSTVKAELEVAVYNADAYRQGLQVSAAEVESEYAANKDKKYRIPDQKKVLLASFPRSRYLLVDSFPEAEMQKYFAAHKAEFPANSKFEDLRSRVALALQQQADETAARKLYDERLSSKYHKQEVKARHILLKLDPEADQKVKDERKALAEKVLAEAKAGKDFAELAKQYSDDPGSKDKGGELGWFSRGQMVPQFETAAFALKKDEFSSIVTTDYGYHLIQKQDARENLTPFDKAKDELLKEVAQDHQQKAVEQARTAAQDFALRAYKECQDKPLAEAVKTFRTACQRDPKPATVIESGFFAAADTAIPGLLTPSSNKAVKEFSKLVPDLPVSEAVEEDGGAFLYVACLLEEKPSYVPALSGNKDLYARIEGLLLQQKALAKAREVARTEHNQVQAALVKTRDFDQAKGKAPFAKLPAFALQAGPSGHPQRNAIMDELRKALPLGYLSAPVDTAEGALMLYVRNYEFPAADPGADNRGMQSYFAEYSTRQMVMGSYLGELRQRYPVSYTAEWRAVIEETPSGAIE